MITPSSKLWSVIVANIPLGEWQSLDSLYQIVEDNYSNFTEEDLGPTMEGFPQEKWKHSVRNVIQNKKTKGDIEHDGQGNYRIERPYVWRMVLEAVRNLSTPCSYVAVIDYINDRWDDVNDATVRAQIIMMTVNHISRIHYPENQKERSTDGSSVYDQFYKIEDGIIVPYNRTVHGVWRIVQEEGYSITQVSSGKVYTPADIKWIKHVSNTEGGTAYMDLTDDVFTVHAPGKKTANLLSPKEGEIIVLYQKIDNVPVFTHLVTPIDDKPRDDGDRPRYKYGRRVKLLAHVDMNNLIPRASTLWSKVNFKGISQSKFCAVDTSKPVDSLDELRLETWRRFEPFFKSNMASNLRHANAVIDEVEQEDDSTISGQEGKLKLVSHYVRERDRKIVAEKKKQAKLFDPELKCEVCKFSFPNTFNQDFIECHHIKPISEVGESETRLEDLALVCANCHRMLHKKFDGEYLSIQELSIKRSQFE